MIRGKVELYRQSESGNEELLYSEDNMIVDGAGEMVAFMMTIPPDGYSISPLIYDASNFSIRSMSFGKDHRAYLQNLHASSGISAVGRQRAGYQFSSCYWVEVSSATTSGYNAEMHLPKSPTPMDTKLIDFYDSLLTASDLQYPHMLEGQNINLLPFYTSIPSSLFGVNVSSLPLSSIVAIGSYAYGPSSAGDVTTSLEVQFRYNNGTTSGVLTASSTKSLSNTYNDYVRKAIDPRGFFKRAQDNINVDGYGLVLSTINLSSNCEIINRHTISVTNATFLDLYGGITSLGLWTFDLEQMLSNGRNPPYSFFSTDTGDPTTSIIDISGNLKYKLFAKKVFQTNILKSLDSGSSPGINNYQNLAIRWKLYFI